MVSRPGATFATSSETSSTDITRARVREKGGSPRPPFYNLQMSHVGLHLLRAPRRQHSDANCSHGKLHTLLRPASRGSTGPRGRPSSGSPAFSGSSLHYLPSARDGPSGSVSVGGRLIPHSNVSDSRAWSLTSCLSQTHCNASQPSSCPLKCLGQEVPLLALLQNRGRSSAHSPQPEDSFRVQGEELGHRRDMYI